MKARVAIVVVAVVVIAAVGVAVAATIGAPQAPSVTSAPDGAVAVAPSLTSSVADSPTFGLAGTVRTAGGTAIAGALACDHPAFGAAIVCARSGDDGTFALRVLAGLHKLEMLAPAGSSWLPLWYPSADNSRDAAFLDLRKGDRADLDVRLDAGRRVSGRIVDIKGAPVGDAQACADPRETDAEWVCARTDADGRYTLVVAPASYLLFFVPPEGTRLIPRWWRSAGDNNGAESFGVRSDVSGVDMTLPPGYLVFGKIVSSSGKPIEHAFVCVDTKFPTGRICRSTDKEGNYSVSVRAGRFVVQIRPSAGEGVVAQWYGGTDDPTTAREISVSSDVRVDVALRSGKLVWGSVKGTDGLPIEGAYVNAFDPSGRFVAGAPAGATGDYFLVVPMGEYRLRAFAALGSPYVSAAYGGGDGRIVSVNEKDKDVLAEFRLELVSLGPAQ